jgi:uncharacterized membrane protein YqaE (UPF0057 family)
MSFGSVVATILLLILAIFIPPVPVLIRTGCSWQLLLNVVLTIFIWLPGVIHAWYIVLRDA